MFPFSFLSFNCLACSRLHFCWALEILESFGRFLLRRSFFLQISPQIKMAARISLCIIFKTRGGVWFIESCSISNPWYRNSSPDREALCWYSLTNGRLLYCILWLKVTTFVSWYVQLIVRSESLYFCKGSIIADSREEATGLMVITAGQVCNMKKSIFRVQVMKACIPCDVWSSADHKNYSTEKSEHNAHLK